MSDWTESWKASNAGYVSKNKGTKSVLERRKVEGGIIYAVALENGSFEVRRHSEDGKVVSKESFPSGIKAVVAYRQLRDKLVPNRAVAKKEVVEEATPAKAKPKAKAKAPAKRKAPAKK